MDEPAISIPRQRAHRKLPDGAPGRALTVEVVLHGHLGVAAAERLLNSLLGPSDEPRDRVRLNLTDVTSASFPAQVMLLSLNRSLRRRGGALELYAPTAELRGQGKALDLFGRVPTIEPDSRSAQG
jgi:hypothetical protein